MPRVLRATERAVSDQPGITTWHAFSAGSHYDPDNVGFGPVIGCDEHLVDPGGGFDWHAHRGVVVVSWVLDGTLRHQDDGRAELLVPAGGLLVQSCGSGIRHRETNASDDAPLRFVQTSLLLDLERSVSRPAVPTRISGIELDVVDVPATLGPGHVFVGSGGIGLHGAVLHAGDTARLGAATTVEGSGTALALSFGAWGQLVTAVS